MLEKLKGILEKFNELTEKSCQIEVISDLELYKKVTKERAELEEIATKFQEYLQREKDKKDVDEMLVSETDADMKEYLQGERKEAEKAMEALLDELKILMLPKDPNDDKNVIMEIRGGAGGDEAALFASELYKMYLKYAEYNRFKTELIDISEGELGGLKEVVFQVNGKGAYSKLKYESGVHRVQRVPATESQGRVHTSTVTVAVLPEAEDVDVTIDEKDIRVDTYRSSGAGGQHINKTDSAIRITHLPTGMVVACQDERSQLKNREKAMRVLKSRLLDYYTSIAEKEYADNRKMQVGTGDRSEKIRTYNFPQGRITDHRIGFSLFSIEKFMAGEIDEMIEALMIEDRNLKLQGKQD